MKPETRLQRNIRKELRREFPGSWWEKVWGGPYQKTGLPDLFGCVNGLFFGFEVKTDVGTPSEVQEEVIANILAAGGCARIIRSAAEAIEAVYDAHRLSGERREVRSEAGSNGLVLSAEVRKDCYHPADNRAADKPELQRTPRRAANKYR